MFVESVLFFAKQKKKFQHQMTKSGAILTIDGHKETLFFFFFFLNEKLSFQVIVAVTSEQ